MYLSQNLTSLGQNCNIYMSDLSLLYISKSQLFLRHWGIIGRLMVVFWLRYAFVMETMIYLSDCIEIFFGEKFLSIRWYFCFKLRIWPRTRWIWWGFIWWIVILKHLLYTNFDGLCKKTFRTEIPGASGGEKTFVGDFSSGWSSHFSLKSSCSQPLKCCNFNSTVLRWWILLTRNTVEETTIIIKKMY